MSWKLMQMIPDAKLGFRDGALIAGENFGSRREAEARACEIEAAGGGPVRAFEACRCGSNEEPWWRNDARGIPLCKACPSCWPAKRRAYRADVLTDPDYWADEAIEAEGY